MVPFALLLGVGPLVLADPPNLQFIDYRLHLYAGAVSLLPWLFESKVVAMTVLGLAMALHCSCWQLRKAGAAHSTPHENHLQLLGDGGG